MIDLNKAINIELAAAKGEHAVTIGLYRTLRSKDHMNTFIRALLVFLVN